MASKLSKASKTSVSAEAVEWAEAVTDIVTILCETFRQTASQDTIKGYMTGLMGLHIADIQRAFRLATQRSRFMPSPAELRELAGEMKPEQRAQHAWLLVEQAVREVGGYKSVCFADRAINATLRSLGGWERVCGTPARDFDSFLRQNFLKAYLGLCDTSIGDEAGGALLGTYDRENAANGYALSQPRYIGGPAPQQRQPALEGGELPRLELKRP